MKSSKPPGSVTSRKRASSELTTNVCVEAPGLIVLGPANEVELITPPAEKLLEAIRSEAPAYRSESLAGPVVALAAFARGVGRHPPGASNVVTVPATNGWVTLHASRPGGASDGRVAIVIERASSSQSATLHREACGATEREREVATLLARGMSNPDIAGELVLSLHTVEDHTKSLFEKLGVTSRQELVARVFVDEYLPDVVQRTPLTSRGRFEPPGGGDDGVPAVGRWSSDG